MPNAFILNKSRFSLHDNHNKSINYPLFTEKETKVREISVTPIINSKDATQTKHWLYSPRPFTPPPIHSVKTEKHIGITRTPLSPRPSLPVGLRCAGCRDLKFLRRRGSLGRCPPLHQSQHTHCRGQPAGWSPGGKDAGSQRSTHLHKKNPSTQDFGGRKRLRDATVVQKRSGLVTADGRVAVVGQLPLGWLGRWQRTSTTLKTTKGPMEPAGLDPEGH